MKLNRSTHHQNDDPAPGLSLHVTGYAKPIYGAILALMQLNAV
jgi:hypothetical protein